MSRRSTSRWSSSTPTTSGTPAASASRTTPHSSAPSSCSSSASRPSRLSPRAGASGSSGSGEGGGSAMTARLRTYIMPLADTFQEIVDSLPSDWTDMELDLRVEESRYIDAATLLVQVNAQPYSHHDWHWRILVAHQFGHAAAAPTVYGTPTSDVSNARSTSGGSCRIPKRTSHRAHARSTSGRSWPNARAPAVND